MNKTSELLDKCARYEQLATTAAPRILPPTSFVPRFPRSMPRGPGAIPRIPEGMGFHPSGLVVPEHLIPKYEPIATKTTPVTPVETVAPKAAPGTPVETVAPKMEVEAPKTTVLDPKTLKPISESTLDIKFDEHGNVVIPDKWVGQDGKLTINKKQLAEAIHKAKKAKIVRDAYDVKKRQTTAKEMSQVNNMVSRIAFMEKLPARAALTLLTVASITLVTYVIANKKPTSTNASVIKVIDNTVAAAGSFSEVPNTNVLIGQINELNAMLSNISDNPKAKQTLSKYSTMLNTLVASLQKLSAGTNMDNKSAVASFANEITKFEANSVETADKLHRLASALEKKNKWDAVTKINQVCADLASYIILIESARSIKNRGA